MENLVSFNGTEDNIKSDLNDVRKNALLYFSIFNDKDIMNIKTPNHLGLEIGKVIDIDKK